MTYRTPRGSDLVVRKGYLAASDDLACTFVRRSDSAFLPGYLNRSGFDAASFCEKDAVPRVDDLGRSKLRSNR
jgi:hypothetical protein